MPNGGYKNTSADSIFYKTTGEWTDPIFEEKEEILPGQIPGEGTGFQLPKSGIKPVGGASVFDVISTLINPPEPQKEIAPLTPERSMANYQNLVAPGITDRRNIDLLSGGSIDKSKFKLPEDINQFIKLKSPKFTQPEQHFDTEGNIVTKYPESYLETQRLFEQQGKRFKKGMPISTQLLGEGLENAVTAFGESGRRMLTGLKAVLDKPYSLRGYGEATVGGIETAINSLPPVIGLNIVTPGVDEATRSVAKQVGFDENTASQIVNTALPFIFGKWVGIGSLSATAVSSGVEESGVLKGLNPKDKKTVEDLIHNAIFFAVAIKGKDLSKFAKEKIPPFNVMKYGTLKRDITHPIETLQSLKYLNKLSATEINKLKDGATLKDIIDAVNEKQSKTEIAEKKDTGLQPRFRTRPTETVPLEGFPSDLIANISTELKSGFKVRPNKYDIPKNLREGELPLDLISRIEQNMKKAEGLTKQRKESVEKPLISDPRSRLIVNNIEKRVEPLFAKKENIDEKIITDAIDKIKHPQEQSRLGELYKKVLEHNRKNPKLQEIKNASEIKKTTPPYGDSGTRTREAIQKERGLKEDVKGRPSQVRQYEGEKPPLEPTTKISKSEEIQKNIPDDVIKEVGENNYNSIVARHKEGKKPSDIAALLDLPVRSVAKITRSLPKTEKTDLRSVLQKVRGEGLVVDDNKITPQTMKGKTEDYVSISTPDKKVTKFTRVADLDATIKKVKSDYEELMKKKAPTITTPEQLHRAGTVEVWNYVKDQIGEKEYQKLVEDATGEKMAKGINPETLDREKFLAADSAIRAKAMDLVEGKEKPEVKTEGVEGVDYKLKILESELKKSNEIRNPIERKSEVEKAQRLIDDYKKYKETGELTPDVYQTLTGDLNKPNTDIGIINNKVLELNKLRKNAGEIGVETGLVNIFSDMNYQLMKKFGEPIPQRGMTVNEFYEKMGIENPLSKPQPKPEGKVEKPEVKSEKQPYAKTDLTKEAIAKIGKDNFEKYSQKYIEDNINRKNLPEDETLAKAFLVEEFRNRVVNEEPQLLKDYPDLQKQQVKPTQEVSKPVEGKKKAEELAKEKAETIIEESVDAISGGIEVLGGSKEANANLKRQKELVLDRLDKQIAKTEVVMKSDEWKANEKKIKKLREEFSGATTIQEKSKITDKINAVNKKFDDARVKFRIPNDGDVTIPAYNIEFLKELRKRVNSQYPTEASIKLPEHGKIKETMPTAANPEKPYRGEVQKLKVGKDTWTIIDKQVMIKAEPPKGYKETSEQNFVKPEMVEKYFDLTKEVSNAKLQGYVIHDIDYGYSSASFNKLPELNDSGGKAFAIFKTGKDEYVVVMQGKLNLVEKYFGEKLDYSIGRNGTQVIAKKGDEIVAYLTGTKNPKIDSAIWSKEDIAESYPEAYSIDKNIPKEVKAKPEIQVEEKPVVQKTEIEPDRTLNVENVIETINGTIEKGVPMRGTGYYDDLLKPLSEAELKAVRNHKFGSDRANYEMRERIDIVLGEKKRLAQDKEQPKRIVSEEEYKKQKDILDQAKKDAGNTLGAGLGKLDPYAKPETIKALTTVGAYHFENGLRKFSDWSKKMIEEYGETIRKHLREIWKSLDKTFPKIRLNKELADTKVIDEGGNPLTVYSGHSNTPLYKGYEPRKSTAGGFYASESPEIASNYSLGKMGNYQYFEHGEQYRIKSKGGEYNKKLWQIELTDAQKKKLDELANKKDEYDEYEYRLNEMMTWAEHNKDYDPLARRILARGKYDLQTIWEYNENMGYNISYPKTETMAREPMFERQRMNDTEQIMTELGIDWNSYDWAQPGVFPVYLNIKNPLDTSKPFPEDLLKALKDKAKYEREPKYDVSSWTKEYPLKEWVKDIERGSDYWSTGIPKKALPIIKQFGYDGIKELGSKGSTEARQTNWIAFDKEQIIPKFSHFATPEKSFLRAQENLNENRLISKDRYEQAKADAKKLSLDIANRTPSLLGKLDPELIKDYGIIGSYHLETLVRTGVKKEEQFRQWAKLMLSENGEKVRPYLRQVWNDIKETEFKGVVMPPSTPTSKDRIVEPTGEKTGKVKSPVSTTEITPSGEIKPRGLSVTTEAKAVANDLTKTIEGLPEYDVRKNQPQIDEATKIITTDLPRAVRIALGEEVSPKSILPGFIYKGLEDYAVRNADVKLMKELGQSPYISEQATTAGQFIQSLRNQDPLSPITAMKDIIKARKESSGYQRADVLNTKYEAKIKELEDKLAKKEEEYQKLETEKNFKKLQREEKLAQRKEKRTYTKQELKLEREDLYKELYKEVSTTNIGVPLSGKATKILFELTKNYAREGVLTAEAVVDAIYKEIADKIEGISRKDIRDAISGYGRETVKKTKNELQDAINDLRRQMQTISKIEELESGKTPTAKTITRKEPSETLTALKAELKTKLAEYGITEQKNLETAKKMLRNRIVDYNDKIRKGDYSKKEREPVMDEERTKLKSELDAVRDKWKYVQQTLGDLLTEPEAKKIAELSKKAADTKVKMENAPRREFLKEATPEEIEYGRARMEFAHYIDQLRESANKLTWEDFKEKPLGTIGKGIAHLPGVTKSAKATLDNSGLFNQHIKTLWTHPTIWQRNAIKSFKDIYHTFKGENVLAEISADIVSRPNYEKYRKDGLSIGVIEEAFPDSKLIEKIPFIGSKIHKAADTAFTGLAYRNRADLYDLYTKIAENNGHKETTGLGIGKLVNSMTGRGNLGRLEKGADTFNVLFFAPRYVKSHIDVLTAHLFDKDVSPFVKKEAAKNLLKIIGGTAAVMLTAKSLGGEVETDPRSADFGKIKIGNTRFGISGGMNSIVTLGVRLVTVLSNTFGITDVGNIKSTTTGEVYKLNTGKYGAPTGWDMINNFLSGKLSPVAGVVRDMYKGQTFDGEPVTVGRELENLTVPLPITNYFELQNDPQSADKLLAIIADAVGIFTTTYSSDPNLRKIKNVILSSDQEKFTAKKKANFYQAINQAVKDNVITKSQAENYKRLFEESQKSAPIKEDTKPKKKSGGLIRRGL